MLRWIRAAAAGAALAAGAGCNFGPPLTPLIGAARDGDAARVTALVRAGADPNQRGGVNGWTPLMHAIHKNRIASVRALLDEGADMNAWFGDGETALMMAAGYGQTDIVQELLRRGADPRATDAHRATALDYAVGGVIDIDGITAGKCQTATVRALLAKAPDLRIAGSFAKTAARLGRCTEVLELISRR